MDALSGTQGALPHFSQLTWRFAGRTSRNARIIVVNGVRHYVGNGNPGDGSAGDVNNCLIDSLRQCVGLQVDRRLVRRDLLANFAKACGRARVDQMSYLDVDAHWRAILASIFRHNTSGVHPTCALDDYCVVALREDMEDHGVVLGSFGARFRLVVLNYGDRHFDPCLPF